MTDPASIQLRPATHADLEFLYRVQHDSMRPHIERVYGAWDEEERLKRFHAKTDPASHDIIELDGVPVGCQWVRRDPDALFLVRIYLMPAVHGRGIGTHVVNLLLERARRERLPVRLRVLKGNPAKRLYARLGFRVTKEIETHHYMESR